MPVQDKGHFPRLSSAFELAQEALLSSSALKCQPRDFIQGITCKLSMEMSPMILNCSKLKVSK